MSSKEGSSTSRARLRNHLLVLPQNPRPAARKNYLRPSYLRLGWPHNLRRLSWTGSLRRRKELLPRQPCSVSSLGKDHWKQSRLNKTRCDSSALSHSSEMHHNVIRCWSTYRTSRYECPQCWRGRWARRDFAWRRRVALKRALLFNSRWRLISSTTCDLWRLHDGKTAS